MTNKRDHNGKFIVIKKYQYNYLREVKPNSKTFYIKNKMIVKYITITLINP